MKETPKELKGINGDKIKRQVITLRVNLWKDEYYEKRLETLRFKGLELQEYIILNLKLREDKLQGIKGATGIKLSTRKEKERCSGSSLSEKRNSYPNKDQPFISLYNLLINY